MRLRSKTAQNSKRQYAAPVAIGALLLSFAGHTQDLAVPDDDFDVGFEDFSLVDATGEIIGPDAIFTGNPLSGLVKNWPEDLVVAPIPGRGSELGWNLKLLGGYFLNNENLLPAVGAGVRFVISQKHRVGLAFDVGVGKDGAEYYVSVGEAF